MIEAGTILQNRYRVKKQIGQGGMGAVYVATDERFGSTVAVKETLFVDENYCKAFEREARLLNSLRHPALPTVSDHFVEGKVQFIVMEYIAGEDLAEQLVKNGKPFPLEDVLIWANQLLDALEFLHNQEMPVIHRDIKPQNLKLTKRNQIILLDFGLAKGNPTDVSHHTAAKSIFGYSPGYASLEQIQGTGTEPRSDLYSLAATLYHLLTGVPPTDALTRAMSVLNEQDDPLRPANLVNPQIPFGVSEVLRKAMALNANHRPASAAIMRQLLDESDKNVDVGDFKTISDESLPTDIFTQNTRLFTDKNRQQSEIKTEVLSPGQSDYADSRETVLINNNVQNTVSGGSKRKYKIGAAVFGAFLLFGFGMYALNIIEPHPPNPVIRESGFSTSTNGGILSESNMTSGDVKISDANSDFTEINPANQNANTLLNLNPLITDSSIKKDKKTSEASTQKSSVASKTTGKGTNIPPEPEEPFIVEDEEDGDVKIYKDRIETDKAIVESNKLTLLNKGKVTVVTPLDPEGMRRLTPEQRRKLFRLRQMQKRFPNTPKPPVRQSTPEN